MQQESAWFRFGELAVAAISDGYVDVSPGQFIPDADWDLHADLVGPNGKVRLDVGAFLVRTGDRIVLIDAGFGRPADTEMASMFACGDMPNALAHLGVDPAQIDTVVCTHLHRDHAGWLLLNGKPWFPNATVRFGIADWDGLIADRTAPAVGDELRDGMQLLADLGRIAPINSDMAAIAPGITTRHAPGHTPGHQIVVLGSGQERMVIFGDAIACPLQISQADLGVTSDVDPTLARRTRETILREMEGALASGPHFPGLAFKRILRGEGKLYYS